MAYLGVEPAKPTFPKDFPAAVIKKRSAGAANKIFRTELGPIDHADRHAVRDEWTKFFH